VFQKDPLQKTTNRIHIPLLYMLLAARLDDSRGQDQKTAAINGSRRWPFFSSCFSLELR